MAEMAESGTGARLFVRQSSGLVRDVSVTNALFFNVAAFVGVGLTLYPIFYSLGFVPVWKYGPFSEYGWAAIITGLFCVLLAIIFASLTSVMPRSGGDYVFTSRITHPFLGWMEAWTLVIASVLIIAFEVPLVLRNLQITARIIGIGAGGHFFKSSNTWFTDSTGAITGSPGFIGSLVVLAVIAGVVLLPTRTFHKVVTALAIFGVASFVAMFIFGLLATSRSDFEHNLPQYTGGVTAAKIAASGHATFLPGTTHHFLSDLFSRDVFPFMLSILLFQYIGFQYSAYIAGEVRGNVRRSVLVALLGALVIGVLANSVYVDSISNHLGFNTNVSWGASYWGFNENLTALPLGQPNAMPLLGVISNDSLWPIWAIISLAGAVFPFLLCPVYINFISRMQLAWSLDRQFPSWFGEVNERMRAPLNAILTTLGLTAIFLFFQSYNALPHFLATTGHKLNLAGTAWFSITMAILTWTMPGLNALLVRVRRPDLVRNAPFARALPWVGLGWLLFPVWVYIFAVGKPIWDSLSAGGSKLDYLETNGILDALIFYALGVVIYLVMSARSRAAGVDTHMLFTEIPPD
ncbi:MAG TPA: APC family permease [Gaiellales bacterium]|jgi:amino acid transporter|nr:APC family permease [Gaiellales bacterium]